MGEPLDASVVHHSALERSPDSILEFAKELGRELDALASDSVLTLPSIDL